MLAAAFGHESIVRLLLDVPNINTTMESQFGETAMSIALAEGYAGIVWLLQEFQSRCEVELEDRTLDPATVVTLDTKEEEDDNDNEEGEEGDEEDEDKDKDGPVNDKVSDSDDSGCYEDAEEWLDEG
ncbi:hypothetical protein BKA70DRAFT_1413951 [Coprinopsis sp. MPI-PUGE-AT-0042]|nr:hypothetical protein BKA70DRAFT_1413951 [Coprinopsis sp. MPI-PUGE-AT-0042]